MKPSASGGAPPSADEPVLFDLVEEMAARLQSDDAAAVEAWIAAQGVYAERLRRLLPTVRVMAELGSAADRQAPPGAEDSPVSGLLGDFRLVREVGRGGMGIVYEAEQVSLRRRVALKVLPLAATLDPRQLARFRNETYAAASLHHQHIVPVYYVGCERGVHYYAMQFIDGQPLSAVLQGLRRAPGTDRPAPEPGDESTAPYRPRVPTPDAPAAGTQPLAALTTEGPKHGAGYFRAVARLGEQAAEALQHAHDLGVLHRDVKPGNLLLDGRGNVWVTDFGLARVQSEASLTVTGDLVGTLRYMSPEQALARRAAIDHRTDVYSLGATLYELLTLRPVFAGKDRQELMRQIAFEEPVPPRRVRRAVPAELETIVLKALEKAPQDRYATAQELADDLGRFLQDRPIQARRPSVAQRLRKWARRNRAVVGAGLTGLVAGLVLLAGSLGWIVRDRQTQRVRAEDRVRSALAVAELWLRQGTPQEPELQTAVRTAESQLASGSVGADLQHQVEQLRADVTMLTVLEDINLALWATNDETGRAQARQGSEYERAFRDYGIDVRVLTIDEAAARIKDRVVRVYLAAALDEWALLSRAAAKPEGEQWCQRLLSVSREADPDPWRTSLRLALASKGPDELKQLVASSLIPKLAGTTLELIGGALRRQGEIRMAVDLLRQAQQRYPTDFRINHHLAVALTKSRPPELDEAIGFFRVAVALRPNSSIVRNNLGAALGLRGKRDEAIVSFREAILLDPGNARGHLNLGIALFERGDLEGAISSYGRALALKPDYVEVLNNLGLALFRQGKPDEAIACFRQAVRLQPDCLDAHNNLAGILIDLGKLDEAIATCRRAIRLKPDYAEAHSNLGVALSGQGRLEEAIASYRQAIRYEPDYAVAHSNLGEAFFRQGKPGEAISSCREALRLQPNLAQAHANLGEILVSQGKFAEALVAARRAHELGSKDPSWHRPSGQFIRECERLVALDDKLPNILQGRQQPADNAERLALAALCQQEYKRLYATAVHFYEQAFAAEPGQIKGQPSGCGYNAACAAALAGCGQGKDCPPAEGPERTRLRRQALDWLRANLGAWQQALVKDPVQARDTVAKAMAQWLGDADLAGVRGADSIARLPEAERADWEALWKEVEVLRRRAEPPPPAHP
jgi:tetratricopeptide (TPR) repeat protein/serine/threonine protein kinase